MKSVIFNTQEVIATLEGRKNQFRIPCKIQPTSERQIFSQCVSSTNAKHKDKCRWIEMEDKFNIKKGSESEYFAWAFQIGDEIFVKEAFVHSEMISYIRPRENPKITYKADSGIILESWLPASQMKQPQSRLILKITDISVERLADISEEDAIAEGFNHGFSFNINTGKTTFDSFIKSWNSTHKKPSEKWEASPWVWKICFEIMKNN